MISQIQTQEFMEYFTGSLTNYGEHIYSVETAPGQKSEGKSFTKKHQMLTIKQYEDHLNGVKGLGIIPINENNKCKFVTIDIDIYDFDLSCYLSAIEDNSFPIVPIQSKSGGLHLYIFFKEFVPAKKAIHVARTFSFILSVTALVKHRENRTVEIFPKQAKLAKGEVGSWINLPYYNDGALGTKVIKNGVGVDISEALAYIRVNKISLEEADELFNSLHFNDAPPCLQLINILNPLGTSSGRNNFLFSFGVYLKKKDEDFFEQNLKELNASLRYPISGIELERTIIASLKKKDYLYRCTESPCVDYCFKKVCKKREYGIGKEEGYFSNLEYGKLYQFKMAQPYYEWEVKIQGSEMFKRLRFKSEDEIIKQDTFLKLCMRELYELPVKVKAQEWFKNVNEALKTIQVHEIHEDDDTSPIVILKTLLIEFLVGRAKAETKNQIYARRAYFDADLNEYQFRVKDAIDFIYSQKQFRYFTPSEFHGVLRNLGNVKKTIRTEDGRQLRVATLPRFRVENNDFQGELLPIFTAQPEEDF